MIHNERTGHRPSDGEGSARCAAASSHTCRLCAGHNFAMELGSQRVWDYAADGYVHRLIQVLPSCSRAVAEL